MVLLGKMGTSNYVKAEQPEFSTSCALHNQNFEEKSETGLTIFSSAIFMRQLPVQRLPWYVAILLSDKSERMYFLS